MENTVNQLVLDCAAKVLRINETTDAEIYFEIQHCGGIACCGWTKGYNVAEKEHGEKPTPDFCIGGYSQSPYYGVIYLDSDSAESRLRALLGSLNTLEKELAESKEEKA